MRSSTRLALAAGFLWQADKSRSRSRSRSRRKSPSRKKERIASLASSSLSGSYACFYVGRAYILLVGGSRCQLKDVVALVSQH